MASGGTRCWLGALAGLVWLTGCEPFQDVDIDLESPLGRENYPYPEQPSQAGEADPDDSLPPGSAGGLDEAIIFPGDDVYLNPDAVAADTVALAGEDGVILNFENIELREFARAVLGGILRLNYFYDPRVQGTVSLQTAEPMPEDSVLAAAEMIFRQNGAALVLRDGIYRVIPAEEATRAQAVTMLAPESDPLPQGYQVMIIPLRFISAVQMSRLLEPLLPPEGIIRADVDRNLLVLAGASPELAALRSTVQIFDVDWLQGMSAGLFPLTNVSAEQVAEELDAVFGDLVEGPLAGLIRFVPIERLNALLVVTQRSQYLARAQTWIQRLDRGAASEVNLYVYYIQNGKAVHIAEILNQIFSDREERRQEVRAEVAPGLEAATVGGDSPADAATPAAEGATPPTGQSATEIRGVRRSGGIEFTEGAEIRIIADEVNNALLILATPRDYRMVQAALRKLDIVPLQVVIDATIADVTLNEELRYGVQNFFQRGNFQLGLSEGDAFNILPGFPGFAVTFETQDTSIILDALNSVTKVNVVSSPRLMVLDNQTARLQVGDEVPVITQQQQSVDANNANIVNSIQFRETGVILNITPRVNSGGLVTMEIEQEVSNVSQQVDSGVLTPTIAQREIESSIAVQSGETVLLGGLIQQNVRETRTGIPLLSDIPYLGDLFSSTDKNMNRTELIVLITPRVVRNPVEARQITEQIRKSLKALAPALDDEADDEADDGGEGEDRPD